jgi:hypothetical protein
MATPSMVPRRGATIFKTKKINLINLMWELTFWMKVNLTQWGYYNYRLTNWTHHESIAKMDKKNKTQDEGIVRT